MRIVVGDGISKEHDSDTFPTFLMVHPFGNPNSSHAARALLDAHALNNIVTSFDIRRGTRASELLAYAPLKIQELCQRRDWIPDGDVYVDTYPWPELKRLFLLKTRLQKLFGLDERSLIDRVCVALDTYATSVVSQAPCNALYGYEDMCATLFQSSVAKEKWRVYELTSLYYAYYHSLIAKEVEEFPELRLSVPALRESKEKLERKDMELQEADLVIVPSTAVKRSLEGSAVDQAKIHIVTYGAELSVGPLQREVPKQCRIMYAGRQSVSKGVHRLLEAFARIDKSDARLVLCGHKQLPKAYYARYQERVLNRGALSLHEIQAEYAQASVVVLPTLSDAFGLVVLEAMSQGVPVIVTDAAGAADVIDDGIDGFVIPSQNTEALEERLQWCVDHPEELWDMGLKAHAKAMSYSWERYHTRLLEVLGEQFALYCS